jgi:hypothetical protein
LADEILVDFLTLMARMTDDFPFKYGMDWDYPNLINTVRTKRPACSLRRVEKED